MADPGEAEAEIDEIDDELLLGLTLGQRRAGASEEEESSEEEFAEAEEAEEQDKEGEEEPAAAPADGAADEPASEGRDAHAATRAVPGSTRTASRHSCVPRHSCITTAARAWAPPM